MKGAAITVAVIIAFFGAVHLWDKYLFPAYANWRGEEWKIKHGYVKLWREYRVEDDEAERIS